MRYIYLIPLICLSLLSGVSAQYQEVLSANVTKYDIKIEPFDILIDDILRIEGDTLFNELSYKKVYWNWDTLTLLGLVRESELSDKMWFYNMADGVEHLIMDLEMEINDTFQIHSTWGPEAIVKDIDVVDGRKVVTFDQEYGGGLISDTLRFIEGVGPNATILLQTTGLVTGIPGFGYQVCRMYQEDTLNYPSSADIVICDSFTISVPLVQVIDYLQLCPNPTSGICSVIDNEGRLEPRSTLLFQLYDLAGMPLMTRKFEVGQQINISSTPSGIYIYQLFYKNDLVGAGRMMKLE